MQHHCVYKASLVSMMAFMMVGASGGASAQTPSASSSSAFGLSADFTVGDLSTGLGPVALAQGSAPPAYNQTVKLATFNDVVPIIPGSAPVVALYADATKLKSHAASNGIGIDFVSAEADASLKSADLAINLNPLPPGSTPPEPQPYLQLSGTAIKSTANFDQTFPQPPVVTGTASFGSLTISGSLLGNTVLTFSGPAEPNTILYQSSTVTVILNHQAIPVALSCPSIKCTSSPTNITTDAVSITLNGAVVGNTPLSGQIAVAQAQAR